MGQDLTISTHIGGTGVTDGRQYARIDKTTGTIQTIDYSHHEIHAGSHFAYFNAWDLGNAAVKDLLIKAGSTALPHLFFDVSCEAETDIVLYRAPTVTTAGRLAENPETYNRRHDSTATASMFVYDLSTLADAGTMILHDHIGSAKTSGGIARDDSEHVLAANTWYLLRITNATTSNNYIRAKLDWYEHTDKTEIDLID